MMRDIKNEIEQADYVLVGIGSEWKAQGGMLPKLNNCIEAIENGVKRVHILDGRILHCLLLEIFTNKGIGTAILDNEGERFYDGN